MTGIPAAANGRSDGAEPNANGAGRSRYRKGRLLGGITTIIIVILWACVGAEVRPMDFFRNAGNMSRLLKDFFPPDFNEYRYYFQETLVTLQIAISGTFLAALAAVPLAILSSDNVAPYYIRLPIRRAMDLLRSVNALVFAMLFVVVVGLGPFAGVLAISFHTTGVLAKMFSEAVEAVDPGPVMGIRASGASAGAEVLYGIIPQVIPHWISHALYRLESNIRSATVVGLVGGGGIGVVLWEYIRGFQFARTSAILIVIVVVVGLVDITSARIRKRFI